MSVRNCMIRESCFLYYCASSRPGVLFCFCFFFTKLVVVSDFLIAANV